MNQKLEIHQLATFIEKELLIHLSVEILRELHVTNYHLSFSYIKVIYRIHKTNISFHQYNNNSA